VHINVVEARAVPAVLSFEGPHSGDARPHLTDRLRHGEQSRLAAVGRVPARAPRSVDFGHDCEPTAALAVPACVGVALMFAACSASPADQHHPSPATEDSAAPVNYRQLGESIEEAIVSGWNGGAAASARRHAPDHGGRRRRRTCPGNRSQASRGSDCLGSSRPSASSRMCSSVASSSSRTGTAAARRPS
jgi:hypothetical protein